MKPQLIIGFFTLLCVSFLGTMQAYAQKEQEMPATHMWIRTAVNSVVYVPARSLKQCITLTQQAASLNSSESNCYNGDKWLKKITCQKALKNDGEASCS